MGKRSSNNRTRQIMTTKSSTMQFEPITHNDLVEIRTIQPHDWADIVPDIEFYIHSSFCHPIKAVIDHRIVGTGTLIIFENSCWIAHIIVGDRHRNKGIGSAIVNELLMTIRDKPIASCSLIATELGKPVYIKAGYRTVASYSFMEREKPWMPDLISENITSFEEKYRAMVYELDRKISGEKRDGLLNDFLPNTILYVENNTLLGFYVPDLKEGFIFADTAEAGLALMQLKYAMIDKAVLPTENTAGVEFLKKNGFVERRTMTRMILGDDIPWQPEKIFSRIGGNLG